VFSLLEGTSLWNDFYYLASKLWWRDKCLCLARVTLGFADYFEVLGVG